MKNKINSWNKKVKERKDYLKSLINDTNVLINKLGESGNEAYAMQYKCIVKNIQDQINFIEKHGYEQ
jgi:hypothetical protein